MPTVNFQTCTGESRSYIAFRMQHRPCPALLHSTDPAQQELEATVFRALGEIRSPSAHPFHVKRIRLSKAHVPIVFLDGATGKVDVSATFLEVCLPGADGGSPAAGFGVRILHIHGRDLVLGLVETDARVIIRGSADTDWNALRSAHSRQVQGNGTPLWHEKRWTPAELALRDHPSSVSPEPRVRMESMLLRRIAIFTSFGSAHRTYAYAGGPDTTKMWLEYDPAVPKRHDELVSALTDPTWGLAMRVESDDCACATDGMCVTVLTTTGGMCVTVLTTAAGDATLRLQSVSDRPVWGARALRGNRRAAKMAQPRGARGPHPTPADGLNADDAGGGGDGSGLNIRVSVRASFAECGAGNDSEHEKCHRDQRLRIPRRASIDVGVTLVIGRIRTELPRRHRPIRSGRSGVVAQLHPRARSHSRAATSAPSPEVR